MALLKNTFVIIVVTSLLACVKSSVISEETYRQGRLAAAEFKLTKKKLLPRGPDIKTTGGRNFEATLRVHNGTARTICVSPSHVNVIYKAETGSLGHDHTLGELVFNPNNVRIAPGDSEAFHVSGGRLPYIRWDIDDNSIDQIRGIDRPNENQKSEVGVRLTIDSLFEDCNVATSSTSLESPPSAWFEIKY